MIQIDANLLVMYVLLTCMTVITALIVYKRYQTMEVKSNIINIILCYVDEISDLVVATITVMKLAPENFNSIKEYHEALRKIVITEVRHFMIKNEILPEKILNKLDDESLGIVIDYVVTYLESNKLPKKRMIREQIVDEPVVNETSSESVPTDKVNISSEIEKFYNED